MSKASKKPGQTGGASGTAQLAAAIAVVTAAVCVFWLTLDGDSAVSEPVMSVSDRRVMDVLTMVADAPAAWQDPQCGQRKGDSEATIAGLTQWLDEEVACCNPHTHLDVNLRTRTPAGCEVWQARGRALREPLLHWHVPARRARHRGRARAHDHHSLPQTYGALITTGYPASHTTHDCLAFALLLPCVCV